MRIFLGEGAVARRTVVDPAGHVLHLLEERAAEGRVQFLDTAADRDDRQVRRHGRTDQWQGHGVARGIMREIRHLLVAVVMRLDVGAASRQQEAVEACQDLVGRQVLGEGWDQERHRARALGDDSYVFLGDLVHEVVALAARAAGDRHGGPREGTGVSRHGVSDR